MPMITGDNLGHLLSKLGEDVQESTGKCIKHVQ
jgi:hypothetical protein